MAVTEAIKAAGVVELPLLEWAEADAPYILLFRSCELCGGVGAGDDDVGGADGAETVYFRWNRGGPDYPGLHYFFQTPLLTREPIAAIERFQGTHYLSYSVILVVTFR